MHPCGRRQVRDFKRGVVLLPGAAMILAAGLEGVREKLDPGVPHTENMYKYTLAELKEKEIKMLPRTLGEAVDAFEGGRG